MARECDQGLDMDQIDADMKFHPAHEVGISCGTVPLDPEYKQLLIVKNKRLDIYQLPKGRRDVEEPLFDTALRETHEETGFKPYPLALLVPTRAQLPRRLFPNDEKPPKTEILSDHASKEFIGTCTYRDPQSRSPSDKTVYFWTVTADSTATPDRDTQDEGENLEPKWIDIDDAANFLRFRAEIEAVEKAVSIFERSGIVWGEKFVHGGRQATVV
ncbi:NUDIX hydrolase domain-like protein [Apiosordaria backusii]|uniref:NUDIX hydrolase domain-like protein n=1 Tax=Apiosordaria backusii TaxID=314023 RepID=A0AA40AXJ0_9PEZI|nr:NUDIX hydrolase domain-like protein [Apiosordaria backusii]